MTESNAKQETRKKYGTVRIIDLIIQDKLIAKELPNVSYQESSIKKSKNEEELPIKILKVDCCFVKEIEGKKYFVGRDKKKEKYFAMQLEDLKGGYAESTEVKRCLLLKKEDGQINLLGEDKEGNKIFTLENVNINKCLVSKREKRISSDQEIKEQESKFFILIEVDKKTIRGLRRKRKKGLILKQDGKLYYTKLDGIYFENIDQMAIHQCAPNSNKLCKNMSPLRCDKVCDRGKDMRIEKYDFIKSGYEVFNMGFKDAFFVSNCTDCKYK